MAKKGYYGKEGLGLAWNSVKLSWVAPYVTTHVASCDNVRKKSNDLMVEGLLPLMPNLPSLIVIGFVEEDKEDF